MAQRVILDLKCQSLDTEIQVSVEIYEEDRNLEFRLKFRKEGTLPPNPSLFRLLEQWRGQYRGLAVPYREIQLESVEFGGSIQAKKDECDRTAHELHHRFQRWLESDSFRPISNGLQVNLDPQNEIRLFLRTEQHHLRQLPWQVWDLFESYRQAEAILSHPNIERVRKDDPEGTLDRPIRILAILGNSDGIDIECDRTFLKTFSTEAEVCFLPQPTRQELNDALWHQSWDIFFFAGHSHTEDKHGVISLNSQEELPIQDLAQGLRRAIAKGLKIAIFNSCDGLGLAQDLEQLQIPSLVVMREPVPDAIAQEFLKSLLSIYSQQDLPLHLAVREAREKLAILERDYPCASHLPILCQNPTTPSPTWRGLRTGGRIGGGFQAEQYSKAAINNKVATNTTKRFTVSLLIGLGVAIIIFCIRWTGGFQVAELYSFDHLMQNRPIEKADSRLLIVGADADDLAQYGIGGSIKDEVWANVINYLEKYHARVIGFHVLKDRPVPEKSSALGESIENNENLIASCTLGGDFDESTAPPVYLSNSSNAQLSFGDLWPDSDVGDYTGTIRRYLLSRTVNQDNPQASKCNADISFALYTAYRYLEQDDKPDVKIISEPEIESWRVGHQILGGWLSHRGGYQQFDDSGSQILINYRQLSNIEEVGKTVSISDLLVEGQDSGFRPEWIENRAVIVGVIDPTVDPKLTTPLGRISKLAIQAHVVSELIAIAMGDKRPLWSWVWWQDFLWVVIWSVLSAVLSVHQRSVARIGITVFLSILLISAICQFCLSFLGGWIPLVPTTLGVILASLSSKIFLESNYMRKTL